MTPWIVWAAKLLNAALGFAISIIIARILGPTGRAEYFLAATVAAGVFATCHLSLNQSIFWAVTERRASVVATLRTIAPLAGVLCVASVALYWLLAGLGILKNVPSDAVLVGTFLAPVLFARFIIDAVLYTTGRSILASVSLVATAVLQLIGITSLAAAGAVTSTTVLAVSGATTLVGGLGNAVAVFRTQPTAAIPIQLRRLLGVGLRNHLGVLGLWLALRADVVIVAQFVSKQDLGFYSLAVTLAELMLLAPDALALSALGRHGSLPRGESLFYSVKIASQAARFGVVEAIFAVALGWPLISLAYGSEWLGAYPALVCLAFGTIALGYMRPLGAAFVRANRALERSAVMLVAATINVAGALLATPALGIVGAAATSTVAYGVGAALLAWRVHSSLGISPWAKATSPQRARAFIARSASRRVSPRS